MWNNCAKEILYNSFERLPITQEMTETSQVCKSWRDASYYIMYKSVTIEEAMNQMLLDTLLEMDSYPAYFVRKVFIDMEHINQGQIEQLLQNLTTINSFMINGSFTIDTENIFLTYLNQHGWKLQRLPRHTQFATQHK